MLARTKIHARLPGKHGSCHRSNPILLRPNLWRFNLLYTIHEQLRRQLPGYLRIPRRLREEWKNLPSHLVHYRFMPSQSIPHVAYKGSMVRRTSHSASLHGLFRLCFRTSAPILRTCFPLRSRINTRAHITCSST